MTAKSIFFFAKHVINIQSNIGYNYSLCKMKRLISFEGGLKLKLWLHFKTKRHLYVILASNEDFSFLCPLTHTTCLKNGNQNNVELCNLLHPELFTNLSKAHVYIWNISILITRHTWQFNVVCVKKQIKISNHKYALYHTIHF